MSADYGGRLKSARRSAGLSQVDLARLAGCSQGNVSKVERSRDGVGSEFTVQFAAVLGVSASWLATGEGIMDDADPTPEEASLINYFRACTRKAQNSILDICRALSKLP